VKGKITRWFNFRGFGFIDVEGHKKDIFVHTNDVKGYLSPEVGDTVEFEIQENYKGPRAVNVEIL
jgi:CspA family cold shock protein